MIRIGWENVRGGYYIKKLFNALNKQFDDITNITEAVAKNTEDIAKNTQDIEKNAQDIHDLTPQGYEELIEEIGELKTEVSNKADTNGSYEDMTVGNAEQLVSTVFVNDNEPYQFRTSGGSAEIGDREYDKIVGGSVVWNQLVNGVRESGSGKGLTYTNIDGKELTITGTRTTDTGSLRLSNNDLSLIASHKYLIDIGKVQGQDVGLRWGASTPLGTINAGNRAIIHSKGTSQNQYLGFVATLDVTYDVDLIPQVFDLTAMFGTAIADYIYALEQVTIGAGVALFKKLFPKDYYEYNAGELMSVKTSSHDMVGFNAYNNVSGTAMLVGGMQYQITGTFTSITFDGTTITPDADGYFTPDKNGVLTVTGGNATDTCVHLVWDGERDGEYEPYQEWEYPLDSDLELSGIPKLDANNKLYYDGDTYESDGTVTRRYGIVDLGTLTWYRNATSGLFWAVLSDIALGYGVVNILCELYTTATDSSVLNIPNKTIWNRINAYNPKNVVVNDTDYSDATSFKSAMSGVMLVYALASPTTEEADPFQNPQIVDNFGTEEYVTTSIVPVGHETKYANNLRAKLEMAPESPNGDGNYIVRQTNGMNTYVPLVIPNELPAAPTEDGNYILKCTVSDGSVSYAWDVQS